MQNKLHFYLVRRLRHFELNSYRNVKIKLYLVTFSAQENTKLVQQLISELKRTTNREKCQWKLKLKTQNLFLDSLIDQNL